MRDNIDAKNVGNNILRYRQNKEMSQSELAGLLCVSRTVVSRWETGDRLPETQILPRICKVFGISLEELLYENNENAETVKEPESETEHNKILFSFTKWPGTSPEKLAEVLNDALSGNQIENEIYVAFYFFTFPIKTISAMFNIKANAIYSNISIVNKRIFEALRENTNTNRNVTKFEFITAISNIKNIDFGKIILKKTEADKIIKQKKAILVPTVISVLVFAALVILLSYFMTRLNFGIKASSTKETNNPITIKNSPDEKEKPTASALPGKDDDSYINKTYCVDDDSLCLCSFFDHGDDVVTIHNLAEDYNDVKAKKERDLYIKPLDKTISLKYESTSKKNQKIYDYYRSDNNECVSISRDGEISSIMFYNVTSRAINKSEFVPQSEEDLIKKANEFFDEYVKNKNDFLKPEFIIKEGEVTNDLVDVDYLVEYTTKYSGYSTETKFQVAFTIDGNFRGMFYINSNLYQNCVQKSLEINKEEIEGDILGIVEDCKEKVNASGYMTFNEANITNQTIGLCYIGKKEFISVNSEVEISYTIHHDEASIEKGKYLYPDEPAKDMITFATILTER